MRKVGTQPHGASTKISSACPMDLRAGQTLATDCAANNPIIDLGEHRPVLAALCASNPPSHARGSTRADFSLLDPDAFEPDILMLLRSNADAKGRQVLLASGTHQVGRFQAPPPR